MKFIEIEWNGRVYKLWAQRQHNRLWIHYRGEAWCWTQDSHVSEKHKKKEQQIKGLIRSALPGRIDQIFIKKGDKIQKGQSLLVMSAMKIEYHFKAEAKGVVADVYCKQGQTVKFNQKLVKINYESN